METFGERVDQPIVNIVGQTVALGPIRRDLVPLYHKWTNDPEVARTLGGPGPVTLEKAEAEYDRHSKAGDEVVFTVYESATLRPIGTTGLRGIDHRHRRAEFAIAIGEKDCWGKGYGDGLSGDRVQQSGLASVGA